MLSLLHEGKKPTVSLPITEIHYDRLDCWPVPVTQKIIADIARWPVSWSVKNATSICALLMAIIASRISVLNSTRGYNEIINTELWKTMFILLVCYHVVLKIHIRCDMNSDMRFYFQKKIDLYKYLWYFIPLNLKDFSKILMPIETIQHLCIIVFEWWYIKI